MFGGREWALQDAGVVGPDTIAWTAAQRLPERLADAAEKTAHHWFENREMFQEMDPLIRDLKVRGYGIYLLSNAGVQFSQYERSLPAYDCFDGMVVSAFVHLMKPDRRIYELLASTYDLVLGECLFVDDVPVNVTGAERVGMQGLVYTGDPADVLRRLGITPGPDLP